MARSLRKLFLPAIAALALIVPPSANAAVVPARSADSFVDSIGVNTHTYYNNTAYYQQFGTVTQRLKELGVRHIRENLVPDRPDQYRMLNALAAEGIKSTLILGDPREGSAGLSKLTAILTDNLQGSVDAVEGPNEWDLTASGTDWMSTLAPFQARLWSQIKSGPLAGLPVIGPSLGNTESIASDISGALDYGNLHSYPNAEPPEWNLDNHLRWATRMSGSKPVMATETGYHTALGYRGGHRPASEATEAVYLPRLFLEYYRRGIVRTFSYELLDEFSDPGKQDPESNFGLLRNDLTPKPAFTALQNLIAICSDSGASFTPGKLDYTIGGDQSDLRQLLLQKSDGSYYLALWRATSVWNNTSMQALSAPVGSVKISFAGRVAGAEEFAPSTSAQPLRTLPGGDSLSVNVGPQVTILRLGATGIEPDTGVAPDTEFALHTGDRPDTGAVPDRGAATDTGDGSGPGVAPDVIRVWVDEPAVERGDSVVLAGRLASNERRSRTLRVQRRKRGSWRTVARVRTKRNGRFRTPLRLFGGIGISRIRVVAGRAKPSNEVRVRVIAPRSSPALVVAGAHRRA